MLVNAIGHGNSTIVYRSTLEDVFADLGKRRLSFPAETFPSNLKDLGIMAQDYTHIEMVLCHDGRASDKVP